MSLFDGSVCFIYPPYRHLTQASSRCVVSGFFRPEDRGRKDITSDLGEPLLNISAYSFEDYYTHVNDNPLRASRLVMHIADDIATNLENSVDPEIADDLIMKTVNVVSAMIKNTTASSADDGVSLTCIDCEILQYAEDGIMPFITMPTEMARRHIRTDNQEIFAMFDTFCFDLSFVISIVLLDFFVKYTQLSVPKGVTIN